MSRALLSYVPLEWQRRCLRLLLKLPLPQRWSNRLLIQLLKL